MGVIQQSINQAISVGGLANHLYQQSPGYQRKMEEEEFNKSTERFVKAQEALALKKKEPGSLTTKDIENAQLQLGERRAAELLARGKYSAYASRVEKNSLAKAISSNPVSPFGTQIPPEYDEQRAQAANQRAEDTARQIAEQNQRNRDIVRQLRGLLPMSQEVVAKRNARIAKEGLNESK